MRRAKILGRNFFNRPTRTVARELIGMYLVRRIGRKTASYRITETEAYVGPRDRASHAARGKTERNAPMFGQAGTIYVYFTYGMHWMLNIVTERAEYPAAILLRGAGKISGPARLTKALQIDKQLNNKMIGPKTGLWFEDRSERPMARDILRTPRIGVDAAGPEWAAKKLRFVLKAFEKKTKLSRHKK